MGFLDKIKETINANETTSKIKEKLNLKSPVMKVCMMGARGVGKTSVLTSMFHDLNAVNSQTNLQLLTTEDPGTGMDFTAEAIFKKHEELLQMFHSTAPNAPIKDAGIAASFDVRDYYFRFGVKGQSARIDLQIRDFPGEFIHSKPDEVKGFIGESNAVLIAIDTPHLMEADGRFCEAKNSIAEITDFFMSTLGDIKEEKLVLFVPLKCEKYYNEGRMQEVAEAVLERYALLIDFLSSGGSKKHVACAVTPILTVGDVVFSDFLRDDRGNIRTIKDGMLPARAIYVFSGTTPSYSPKYCEQPLCYLLSFIAKLYERNRSNTDGSFLKKLAAIFKLFPDDPSLLLEVNRFAQRKVANKDGYVILNGKEFL